jgi:hypothetical protein
MTYRDNHHHISEMFYTSTPPYVIMAEFLISYAQGQLYSLPLHQLHNRHQHIPETIH